MQVYILLDRTGSMSIRWDETLSALNTYVADLATNPETGDAMVTLAAFDRYNGMQFDLLRRQHPVKAWRGLTSAEASPRGDTPLFDAIGRLVPLAESDAPEKAIIVILTDGEENASHELTRAGAQAALDRVRSRGWQVVFLGADFDAFEQAASVGTHVGQTLNATHGNYAEAAAVLAERSHAYAASAAPMSFSASDRARASGKR